MDAAAVPAAEPTRSSVQDHKDHKDHKDQEDHDHDGDGDGDGDGDDDWHITLVMDIPDDLAGPEGQPGSTFETHASDEDFLDLSIEETGYQEPAATAHGIIADTGAELPHPKLSKDAHIVVAAKRSDIGRRRKNNQDSFLVLEDEHVFLVADGMGGYAGGEIASKIAVETIQEAFRESRFDAHVDASLPQPAKELAQAMQAANLAIWDAAVDDPKLEGMGTTLVGARFSLRQRRGYIGHVGDSRCYRLRDGVLEQLTTDHTLGVLGVTGRDAVKLYRAVGIIPEVAMDIVMFVPSDGDTYLLCSDGLTKMVSEDFIRGTLASTDDLEAAAQRLIDMANAAGGKDNVTVVLCRVTGALW